MSAPATEALGALRAKLSVESDALRVRAEKSESELDSIKRGHGELGRYEKLRLKNASLTAELSNERARLQYLSHHEYRMAKPDETVEQWKASIDNIKTEDQNERI